MAGADTLQAGPGDWISPRSASAIARSLKTDYTDFTDLIRVIRVVRGLLNRSNRYSSMVAEIVGRRPGWAGKSTRKTMPVQTRLQGSAAGMRKIISIRLLGWTHSQDRNRTRYEPISSVYPINHRRAPTRRNSTGNFKSKDNSTRQECR